MGRDHKFGWILRQGKWRIVQSERTRILVRHDDGSDLIHVSSEMDIPNNYICFHAPAGRGAHPVCIQKWIVAGHHQPVGYFVITHFQRQGGANEEI